jgi:anti-sigma B factor antagonist
MSAEPHAWNPLDDRPALTCIVLQRCDVAHVHPIGVLDIATVPMLERQLQEVRGAGFRRLIVDLGGLTFMDSTGLELALEWDAAARQDGFEISFVPGEPAVQRVFEITGTSRQLRSVRPDSAGARRAPSP